MRLCGHNTQSILSIDRDRCIKMDLVHDLAECLVGDITPYEGISKTDKAQREASTMDFLKGLTGDLPGGTEIAALWHE